MSGHLSPVAFAQSESHPPMQCVRAFKSFSSSFYRVQLWQIHDRIVPHSSSYSSFFSSLQLSVQGAASSKRGSVIQCPSLFSRCFFHHSAFRLHCKFGCIQNIFASPPRLKWRKAEIHENVGRMRVGLHRTAQDSFQEMGRRFIR